MKNCSSLLANGINILRQSDKDIESLFAPRSEEIISLLAGYINEIELFNDAYGLVGTDNKEQLVIRHILDSLAPLGIISRLLKDHTGKTVKIADAGTGAGLPGIPLAIVMPNFEFTLIERMGRRAGFLCNTNAILELANVTIEEGELENNRNGHFNLVTFRAFKAVDTKLLKILFNVCANGGVIAAYKGQREKIMQEMSQADNASIQWETVPYNVPFLEEERNLLVIKKTQR